VYVHVTCAAHTSHTFLRASPDCTQQSTGALRQTGHDITSCAQGSASITTSSSPGMGTAWARLIKLLLLLPLLLLLLLLQL
jgi:hypothetical protein